MSANEEISAWIRDRSPAPPAKLLARIEAMLVGIAQDRPRSDALLACAETSMANVLRDGCLTRNAALDLLAVDALVTFAFEAAADDPGALDARTSRALARIAALADPYPS